MKVINRIISLLTVALMLVTSVPVTTVGAASEDEVYTFYTRAEAAESLYNSGNAQQAVSLLTETEFSGRFGNQLSGFAKKVYDDFVSTYVEEGSATLYTFSKTAETTCSFTLGEEYSFSADIENDSIIYGEDYEPLQAALDTAINYAVFALLYDYPGLFWLKSFKWEYKIMASGNGGDGYRGWFDSVVITPIETFEGASALVTDFCSRIDHFTASTDAHRQSTYGERNDYNYFKSIHDIICMFTEYTAGEDYYLHSSAGVYLYGKGVCEGYAKAFKTLCDVWELPCILVSGGADTDKEEDAPHMWNYIQYEGEWYLVDTTWDDQKELCHTYFMADWNTRGFYEAVRDERRADPDFSGTGAVSFTYPVLHGEHVHEWEKSFTVDKNPSCTEKGSMSIHCASCNETKDVTEIAMTDHKYSVRAGSSATCTEDGEKVYVCDLCDTATYTETVPATGHTYTSKVTTPATCSKAGVRTYTCSCGYSYTKSISKLEHTYKTITAKATLSKNGKVENKCTVCGYVSKTTTVYYPKTIRLSKTSYTYNGKVQTPTVTVKDSKGNTLKKDTDYTVKYESGRKSPGKYTVTVTFKGKYTGTKKLYFTIAPKATSKITATQTTTTITLKWNKVTGADGYRVYKYNTKTKKYEKLKDVTKNTLKISKLKAGTAYKYKVRAFTKDDSTIYGSYSDVFETATKCKTPSIKKLTTTKGKASFTWSNVAGESGYQVYYSTKKDSGYKKVASYKTNAVKGSKKKLKSGKKYYFKVRAYKKTASGTVYSAWSAVRSIKIK